MKKGDFIKIDYVGRVSLTGEIFDLTIEDIAKKEGIFDEKRKYSPVLVIMGADMVVPGVEKKLLDMDPGHEREFELSPKDGFGKREMGLIKIISLAQFHKQNINPVPGAFVQIQGSQAKVQSVSGGRVRVDFNHPLSGKNVHYRVKIVEKVDGVLNKAKSLIEYYGIKADTSVTENNLKIITVMPMPDVVKKLVEGKLKEWITEIKEIKFHSEKKEQKKGPATAPGEVSLQRPEEKHKSAPSEGESKPSEPANGSA